MSSSHGIAALAAGGKTRLAVFVSFGFFGVGLPRLFTNAAAFALFLDTFDAQLLPFTYFLSALAIPCISTVFLRLASRFSLLGLLAGSLLANAALLVLLWCGLIRSIEPWMVMAATVWVEVEWTVGNLVFWGLAERVFDVREAKRHFGVIAAGEPIAAIVGGLTLPLLLSWLAVVDLLLISAIAVLIGVVHVAWIAHSHFERLSLQESHYKSRTESFVESLLKPRARTYMGYVVALAFIIQIAFFVVDNAFYALVETRFATTEEMAWFIGVFFSAVGVVTLLSNLFVVAPLLRRFGLRAGLAMVPIWVVFGALGVSVSDTLLSEFAIVFWLGCLTKLLHESIWQGIGWPSFLLLYQPLPGAHRTRALTFLEGVLEPVASAIAAASLLFMTHVLAWRAPTLFLLAAILMLAWLCVVLPVIRRYYQMLAIGVADFSLSGNPLALDDVQSVRVLRDGIERGEASVRAYCVGLMARYGGGLPASIVQRLLDDREPAVRREVLRVLERTPKEEFRAALMERIDTEHDPSARSALLSALAASGHPGAVTVLNKDLAARDKSIQLGAMVGLLRHGGVDGVLMAGERFLELMRSSWVSDRRLAARVLARSGIRAFDTHLLELLGDESEDVRRDAVRAVRTARVQSLLPKVCELLKEPRLRGEATATLARAGDAACPVLMRAFNHSEDGNERSAIVNVLAMVNERAAIDLIATNENQLPLSALYGVLSHLAQVHYSIDARSRPVFERWVHTLSRAHHTLMSVRDSLQGHAHTTSVDAAIDRQLRRIAHSALCIAAVLLDVPALWLRANGFADGEDADARVVELIDELLPARIAEPLAAVVEPSHRVVSPVVVDATSEQHVLGALETLAGAADGAITPWIQATALYALGSERLQCAPQVLLDALDSPHAVVRETALWALSRCHRRALRGVLARLVHDPSARVVRLAEALQG